MCVVKDIWSRCKSLEEEYEELREELRSVIEMLNKHVLIALDESSKIRNTLLIDSLFRAKEIIRSINLYYCGVFYREGIVESAEKEAFEKYCINEVMYPNYYYNHAVLKLYAVFEIIFTQ